MTKHNLPIKERLESKMMPEPNSGCFLWTGYVSGSGRPSLSVKDKDVTAARLAYSEYVGPIPGGMCVLHKCDNGMCVNPDHLFLGTQVDNIKDMDKKGRRTILRGERHQNAKVSDETVEMARKLRSSGMTLHEVARRCGANFSTVWNWTTGRSRTA